jgi:taurine dioxygenase
MCGMAAVIERRQVAVHPTGAALAADIDGIDLAGALGPETVAAIKAAWGEHLVLRFRGQRLGDEDLLRFSRQFGELDWAPIAAANDAPEGRQYVMVVSNVIEDGKAIGQLGAYEAIWHTDMSYIAEPPSASALYSLEVPPEGGDTGFCNMYLTYESLAPELRRQIEGRVCRHDASRNSAGELRRGFVDATDPSRTVGAEHPIVRTHPVTGRKALFVDRGFTTRIVGLPADEGAAILEYLLRHLEQPEFQCRFNWEAHSIALWDNRCAQHRAIYDYHPHRRYGHRVTIRGDRPFYRA